MANLFDRCPENPIVVPGGPPWRRAVTFNPAVLYEDGTFYMYERAAGGLRPFQCSIGMLTSEDGVHFEHAHDQPVLSGETFGCEFGSVQDPRIVKIDERYLMTFALRPYAWHSIPTGLGVPESMQGHYPGFNGRDEENQTRGGIAVSTDKHHWTPLCYVSDPDVDDRNVILFPETIGGRYAVLRRPSPFVAVDTKHGRTRPPIKMSFSEDLRTWSAPETLIAPEYAWEDNRIGGSTPPIRTDAGWRVFYHGVQNKDAAVRHVCYRMGAMLLDLNDPFKVLARTREPILEPQAYYERFGLYIPDVVFPTGAVVVDGLLHLYYGVCDTAIALATAPLERILDHLLDQPV